MSNAREQQKANIFGSKSWFESHYVCPSDQELKQMKISASDSKSAYDSYNVVESACRVGYIHRKNERITAAEKYEQEFTSQAMEALQTFCQKALEQTIGTERNTFINNNHIVADYKEADMQTIEATLGRLLDDKDIKQYIIQNLHDEKDIDDIVGYIIDSNDLLPLSGVGEFFACRKYFKLPNISYGELLDGRMYSPKGKHNWVINSSWMLAHLHKVHEFVVYSTISDDNMIRKTEGHKGEISGFAREIALAHKMGYTFSRTADNEIKMLPPKDANQIQTIKELTLINADLEDKEVKKYYTLASLAANRTTLLESGTASSSTLTITAALSATASISTLAVASSSTASSSILAASSSSSSTSSSQDSVAATTIPSEITASNSLEKKDAKSASTSLTLPEVDQSGGEKLSKKKKRDEEESTLENVGGKKTKLTQQVAGNDEETSKAPAPG